MRLGESGDELPHSKRFATFNTSVSIGEGVD
jgi:hypothetical protein